MSELMDVTFYADDLDEAKAHLLKWADAEPGIGWWQSADATRRNGRAFTFVIRVGWL